MSAPPSLASQARSEPAVKAQEFDSLFSLQYEKPIAGQTALVTGCSSGIGKATACALATAGCNLVLVARRQDKLEELKAEITQRMPALKVTVVAGDVCDDAFYDELKRRRLTAPDILVANAGLAVGKDNIGAANEGVLRDGTTRGKTAEGNHRSRPHHPHMKTSARETLLRSAPTAFCSLRVECR